jgi:hypothetical protein
MILFIHTDLLLSSGGHTELVSVKTFGLSLRADNSKLAEIKERPTTTIIVIHNGYNLNNYRRTIL